MTVLKNTIGAIVGIISYYVSSVLVLLLIELIVYAFGFLPNIVISLFTGLLKTIIESYIFNALVCMVPFIIAHAICDKICCQNSQGLKIGVIVFDILILFLMAISVITNLVIDFSLYNAFVWVMVFATIIGVIVKEDFC